MWACVAPERPGPQLWGSTVRRRASGGNVNDETSLGKCLSLITNSNLHHLIRGNNVFTFMSALAEISSPLVSGLIEHLWPNGQSK